VLYFQWVPPSYVDAAIRPMASDTRSVGHSSLGGGELVLSPIGYSLFFQDSDDCVITNGTMHLIWAFSDQPPTWWG